MFKVSNTNPHTPKTSGNYKAITIWDVSIHCSYLVLNRLLIIKRKLENKNRSRRTILHTKTNLCGKQHLDSPINTYELEVEIPTILEDVNTAKLVALIEHNDSMGIRVLIRRILSWISIQI